MKNFNYSYSSENIYDPEMKNDELKRYREIFKNPRKILTLEEVREIEKLGKNFTNQSNEAILAGIEVITIFPGLHEFLVGDGNYGLPSFDLPAIGIFSLIPNYIKLCYDNKRYDEANKICEYINNKLISIEKNESFNYLKDAFIDSTAFDDKNFRNDFLTKFKHGEFKNYVVESFNIVYGKGGYLSGGNNN